MVFPVGLSCSFWSVLVCTFFSHLVAVNNLDLILEKNDENSESSPQSAQEEPKIHGNRGTRVTLMKWSWKYRGVVCQAEAWRVPKARPFLLTPLLPLTSLFYLLSSPYLSTPLLKLALQILSYRLQKLTPSPSHVCSSCYSSLSFLSALRLWCWQIRSLRAACSSALMREPVTRSTASLSTSWAFCSTPLKRTGPWPTVTTRRWGCARCHVSFLSSLQWIILYTLSILESFSRGST